MNLGPSRRLRECLPRLSQRCESLTQKFAECPNDRVLPHPANSNTTDSGAEVDADSTPFRCHGQIEFDSQSQKSANPTHRLAIDHITNGALREKWNPRIEKGEAKLMSGSPAIAAQPSRPADSRMPSGPIFERDDLTPRNTGRDIEPRRFADTEDAQGGPSWNARRRWEAISPSAGILDLKTVVSSVLESRILDADSESCQRLSIPG